MMDHTRHSEIYDLSTTGVTLIGAGGIGAITALTIAKMGVRYLYLFDDDVIDEVNIPVQFHTLSDVGKLKVNSLKNSILNFTDMDASLVINEPISVNKVTKLYGHIVISAVDSINARKEIWRAVLNNNSNYYLDARMAAEEFHLYSIDLINSFQVDKYEQILNSENEDDIQLEPCTRRSTIFCATMAAGHISNALKRISNHQNQPFHLIHLINQDQILIDTR